MTNDSLPKTQYALQLVGPDQLVLNKSKEVLPPGPHQILCRVEVVGLCFSDLKLLKQFSSHVRKSDIVSGIDSEILEEISSYVPGEKPAVPGHELVVIIEKVGSEVKDFKPSERYLVQTDYRWLRTKGSNAALGYNFEGGLQEYVIMDTRVITSPEGESMLMGVSENLSASAIALIEPWACVEDAYVSIERQTIKADGQMLVVADIEMEKVELNNLLDSCGTPKQLTNIPADEISGLADESFDDIVYFGSVAETVEALFPKLAKNGLINIALCGGKFERDIVMHIGRVHYGGIRIVGTTGFDACESMKIIPRISEIREGDKIDVVGAGGPMGVMHVVRNICQGVKDVTVLATDVDDNRLAALTKIAKPLADENNVEYKTYNPTTEKTHPAPNGFDYIALMAPIPALVAASIGDAAKGAIINIFAGIPATVTAEINLDSYIEKQLYFIGTSGSVLDDMKRVLSKVESGRLDTNVSVAAICGPDNAVQGIRAVEERSIAGKILVYLSCKGLELTELSELEEKMPDIAECLDNGLWTKKAEQKLLEKY